MSLPAESNVKNAYFIDQSVIDLKSEAIIGQRIRVNKKGDQNILVADSALTKVFRQICDVFTGKTTHYLTAKELLKLDCTAINDGSPQANQAMAEIILTKNLKFHPEKADTILAKFDTSIKNKVLETLAMKTTAEDSSVDDKLKDVFVKALTSTGSHDVVKIRSQLRAIANGMDLETRKKTEKDDVSIKENVKLFLNHQSDSVLFELYQKHLGKIDETTKSDVMQIIEERLLNDFLNLSQNSDEMKKINDLDSKILELRKSGTSDTGLMKQEYDRFVQNIGRVLRRTLSHPEILQSISISDLFNILHPLTVNYYELESQFKQFYGGQPFLSRVEKANSAHVEIATELIQTKNPEKILEQLKVENDLIELLILAKGRARNEAFGRLYTETEERIKSLITALPNEVFVKAIASDDFRPETSGLKMGLYRSVAAVFKSVANS